MEEISGSFKQSVEMGHFQLRKKSFPSPGQKGKSILGSKRRTEHYLVITEGGKDVTPKPLNSDVFTGGKERQISVFEVGGTEKWGDSHTSSLNVYKSQSTARFRTNLSKQQVESISRYRGSISYSSNIFQIDSGSAVSTDSSFEDSLPTEESNKEEEGDVVEIMGKLPSKISLILSETTTIILLDIPSCTEIINSEAGAIVQEQNEYYEYMTVGKGRNRKVLQAGVQTVPILQKSRNTDCERLKLQNQYAFAAMWDMFDTFEKEAAESIEGSVCGSDESDIEQPELDDSASIDSYRMSLDEKQMQKLCKNPKFLEAACVIERLLANNCYNEQQKIFRGLIVQDEFRENIEFKYTLNYLWTFANDNTKGRSVNSIHWNPANKDLVAVGYGKYYFADTLNGLVLIWSIKNPVQPERQYSFPEPVTALNFSSQNPCLLAVGFYNGSIVVLNVVSREKMIIGENIPTFEPVWHISWHAGQNEHKNEELVTATFDDGRVCGFSVARKLDPYEVMRVGKADGKLKGYNSMRKCSNLSVPVSRYAAALFLRKHPVDEDIYYVGTIEGVIHKCSVNYLDQHLDLFLAHEGRVNEMQFSPFSKKIFATCGDDWYTRIWAEGISEPLLEFCIAMNSVQGLAWSPRHSTIFASIVGSQILIWDLQRKCYAPQSNTPSPTGSRNTVVQFTDCGRCLIVGDIDGNLHVYSLEDMPFPAFFQENLLFESLCKVLITHPDLLRKVRKLRRQGYGERFI